MWHGEKTSKLKYDENEAKDVTSIDFEHTRKTQK
jgi:hypothetical protein